MHNRFSDVDVLDISQALNQSVLLAIEEILGAEVESHIEKITTQLSTLEIQKITDEIIALNSARKFCLRAQTKFPELNHEKLHQLLRHYIQAQIHFTQYATVEHELLSISQYIRHHFGLNFCIALLEALPEPGFNLAQLIKEHPLEDKAEATNKNNHETPNDIVLKTLDTQIKPIHNFYLYAALKQSVYTTPELQQETFYKILQESLMWMNGQRLACLTGMKLIQKNETPIKPAANTAIKKQSLALHGARKHIQSILGYHIDTELQELRDDTERLSVQDMLFQLKSNPNGFYRKLLSALNTGTRAGLNTYLPKSSTSDILNLIDECIVANINLAESSLLEKEIVKIAQQTREIFGIPTAIELLIRIEKSDFNIHKFFSKRIPSSIPKVNLRTLSENIQQFYLYATIKKTDGFFDPEEIQAKQLFESELWLDLQRQCCIKGMALVQSGLVHQGHTIQFDSLETSLKEYLPLKRAPNSGACTPNKNPYKIPRSTTQPQFNWRNWDTSTTKKIVIEGAPIKRSKENKNIHSLLAPPIIFGTELQASPSINAISTASEEKNADRPSP